MTMPCHLLIVITELLHDNNNGEPLANKARRPSFITVMTAHPEISQTINKTDFSNHCTILEHYSGYNGLVKW